MGCLGYVYIRVFDSDSIWCSCEIVEWEGDMNHVSLNTSTLFVICICCVSIIYGITVTKASKIMPMAALGNMPFATIVGENARAFTAEWQFWIFGVHMECFLSGLCVYWCVIRRNILVGTWWRLINRRF